MTENTHGQINQQFLTQVDSIDLHPKVIYRNLSVEDLIENSLKKNEGTLTKSGSLSVKTGKYTGRSPQDRFIIDDENTHSTIDWGSVNRPFPPEKFDQIFEKMKNFVQDKELFIFDGFVGADSQNRLPIRVINDHAWQNLFAHQLFVRPTDEELKNHKPEFTVMCINDFDSNPEVDGTRSEAFILINLSKKIVLIGSTNYAGEMKKAMFTVMNYLLPDKGIFSNALFCKHWKRFTNCTVLWFIGYRKNKPFS